MYVGVDGCAAGWTSVKYENGKNWELKIFSSVLELWHYYQESEMILIDIPIGLREKGSKPRLCDQLARRILTRKRSSSIFPTPCRSALYAENYESAKRINIKKTGKSLSKQTWNIMPKIKEVYELLMSEKDARNKLIESHPELCFASFAGNKPMIHYKKTAKGKKERINLLLTSCPEIGDFLDYHLTNFDNQKMEADDILDSAILAISASKGKEKIEFIPNDYELDSEGLPMRMARPKVFF
ncbi:MAG: DUF429 domain-containing protein [Candidatus Lokiarchaeota archaeon]|nr:DUF429 domain-containing protein [Candidatus Lokiarchaeota archaeon]MBD3337833.1 DUF429 domain-containing protein [Candidatus Lokiarchaeota archaeon]